MVSDALLGAIIGAIIGGPITYIGNYLIVRKQHKNTEMQNLMLYLDKEIERYHENFISRRRTEDDREIMLLRFEAGHIIYTIFHNMKVLKDNYDDFSKYKSKYIGLMKEFMNEFANIDNKGAKILLNDYNLLEDVYFYIKGEKLGILLDYIEEFAKDRRK